MSNKPKFGKNGGRPPRMDLADAKPRFCAGCGNGLFSLVYRLGTLSKFLPSNTTGHDVLVKFETYVCLECGREVRADDVLVIHDN